MVLSDPLRDAGIEFGRGRCFVLLYRLVDCIHRISIWEHLVDAIRVTTADAHLAGIAGRVAHDAGDFHGGNVERDGSGDDLLVSVDDVSYQFWIGAGGFRSQPKSRWIGIDHGYFGWGTDSGVPRLDFGQLWH